jgi:hypothetical protein
MYLKKASNLDKHNKALETQLENTTLLKGVIKLEDEKKENNEDQGIFDNIKTQNHNKEEILYKEEKSYNLFYLK